MNPFYNPWFLLKMLKSYVYDIDRLRGFSEEKLKIFHDIQIRKMVNYAYSVPIYYDKYKKAGITPADIKGIDDIEKLPVIAKEDIQRYYPGGIIPRGKNKENLIEISTSGTTGKRLTIFGDTLDMILWFFWYIRVLREYDINWHKDKLTIIGDFAPHTIGSGYVHTGLTANLNRSRFFSNIQFLDTNDKPEKIIKEVDSFSPDFIGGYVGMLGHLALLKEKGYGNNINPSVIATIGSMLTDSLRSFLKDVFKAQVFEVYGSTESGTIAFQCRKGSYHVMSDLVYPEFYTNKGRSKSKEPGRMIITRLYGDGTPIIRYNGVNDIVSPLFDKCSCGIPGFLLDKVYGRDDLSLYFSQGRVLLPASISEIHGRVLYELKSNKVRNTRIIQHDMNNIEIQLVFDKNLRNKEPSIEEVFDVITEGYHEKVGKEIKITIREVKKVSNKEPRIKTKVDRNSFKIKNYI